MSLVICLLGRAMIILIFALIWIKTINAHQICPSIETYNININTTSVKTTLISKCSFLDKVLKIFGKSCKYGIVPELITLNKTIVNTRTVIKCCEGWRDEATNCTKPVCSPGCINGECIKPYVCQCQDGWTGSICGDKCQGGAYGSNCSKNCNCGNGSVSCHHVTGECQCAPGFRGQKCQDNCPPGLYGFGCSRACECKYQTQCRASDGFCDCSIHYLYPASPSPINGQSNSTFNLPETLPTIDNSDSFLTYEVSGFFTGSSCAKPCNPLHNCTFDCDCDFNHGDCNVFTGHCVCKHGYTGKRCETQCSPGTFGPDCLGNCMCKNNSTCDHVTGRCDCLPGWSGESCQYSCQKGFYGVNCASTCHTRCQNYESCHSMTGHCVCKDGWIGSDCSIPCPDGTFGFNCSYKCSCGNLAQLNLTESEMLAIEELKELERAMQSTTVLAETDTTHSSVSVENKYWGMDNFYEVYNQSVNIAKNSLSKNYSVSPSILSFDRDHNVSNLIKCDSTHGRCLCVPGRTGSNCMATCPQGTYGKDCSQMCKCEHALKCNAIHGKCETCEEGWHGERCHIACEKGFYGPNCASKCECVGAETCHPITGTCICPSGKTGKNCEEDCPQGYFGIFCQHRCSCYTASKNNSTNSINSTSWCDPVSGYCSCPPGFSTRWRCNRCQSGYYGLDCQKRCGCDFPNSELREETSNSNATGPLPCKRKTGECICLHTSPTNREMYNVTTIQSSFKRVQTCLEELYRSYDFDTGSSIDFPQSLYRYPYLTNFYITNGHEFNEANASLGRPYPYDLENIHLQSDLYRFYLNNLTKFESSILHKATKSSFNTFLSWANNFNSIPFVLMVCSSTVLVIVLTAITVYLCVRRRNKHFLKHQNSKSSFPCHVMGLPTFSRPTSGVAPSPPPIDFLVQRIDDKRNHERLYSENIYSLGDGEGEEAYGIDYEYPTSVFGTMERRGFTSLNDSPDSCVVQKVSNIELIGEKIPYPRCNNVALSDKFKGLNASLISAAKKVISKNSPAKNINSNGNLASSHGIQPKPTISQEIKNISSTIPILRSAAVRQEDAHQASSNLNYLVLRDSTSSTISSSTPLTKGMTDDRPSLITSSSSPDSKSSDHANTPPIQNDDVDNNGYLIPKPVLSSPANASTSPVTFVHHNYHKLDYSGQSFKPPSEIARTQRLLRQYYEHNKLAMAQIESTRQTSAATSYEESDAFIDLTIPSTNSPPSPTSISCSNHVTNASPQSSRQTNCRPDDKSFTDNSKFKNNLNDNLSRTLTNTINHNNHVNQNNLSYDVPAVSSTSIYDSPDGPCSTRDTLTPKGIIHFNKVRNGSVNTPLAPIPTKRNSPFDRSISRCDSQFNNLNNFEHFEERGSPSTATSRDSTESGNSITTFQFNKSSNNSSSQISSCTFCAGGSTATLPHTAMLNPPELPVKCNRQKHSSECAIFFASDSSFAATTTAALPYPPLPLKSSLFTKNKSLKMFQLASSTRDNDNDYSELQEQSYDLPSSSMTNLALPIDVSFPRRPGL